MLAVSRLHSHTQIGLEKLTNIILMTYYVTTAERINISKTYNSKLSDSSIGYVHFVSGNEATNAG